MKISVIVPVYNAEETLRQCMDSLLGQTLEDIEILTVDNGSTDGSRAILDAYAERDGRVKVLSLTPNRGPAGARNAALDEARGEYIAFCDCDDSVPKRAYESLWKASGEGTADVVTGDYLEVKTAGGESKRHRCGQATFTSYIEGGAVWNRLFRRAFLADNALRFEPYHYGEDTLFAAQTYQKAEKLAHTPQIVYSYRSCGTNSLVNTNSLGGLEEYTAVQRKLLQMLHDEAAEYCCGVTAFLRDYWWKIPVLTEKEAGFRVLQDLVRQLPWERTGTSFEAIFGVDLQQFSSMSLGAYMAAQPWLDEQGTVLRQFADGQVGARYIARCGAAWLKYKFKKMRGNK